MGSISSIVDCDSREDKLALVYLDADPLKAAMELIDRDLLRQLNALCIHMSACWASVAPQQYVVDWYMTRQRKEPVSQGEVASLVHEVHGQRVRAWQPLVHTAEHPVVGWLRESRGNYRWAWRHGMSIACHILGMKGSSPNIVALWALEQPPHAVDGDMWEPPYTGHEDCRRLTEDGLYVDGVYSWRAMYIRHRGHQAEYTGRLRPSWF